MAGSAEATEAEAKAAEASARLVIRSKASSCVPFVLLNRTARPAADLSQISASSGCLPIAGESVVRLEAGHKSCQKRKWYS